MPILTDMESVSLWQTGIRPTLVLGWAYTTQQLKAVTRTGPRVGLGGMHELNCPPRELLGNSSFLPSSSYAKQCVCD